MYKKEMVNFKLLTDPTDVTQSKRNGGHMESYTYHNKIKFLKTPRIQKFNRNTERQKGKIHETEEDNSDDSV